MLNELIEIVEKDKKIIYEQNGIINRETESLKINQKEILEMKSTITEWKIY